MDADRWHRAAEVFEAAVDRPDRDQHAYVQQACAGDADLLRDVEALIDADRRSRALNNPLSAEAIADLGAIAHPTNLDRDAAESTISRGKRRRFVKELIAELAAADRGSSTMMGEETSDSRPGERTRWGPFELREPIGSGHFGTVYLAWDSALEREVAVKLLRETARSAEINQEGRLLARVRHPNVVTVYGVDSHDGVVGLWMEFVDGLSLARVLATRGAMEPAEAAFIGVDLCRAVAAVHRAGLVHRDIKAPNVMREGSGRIVLMDFGVGEIRSERCVKGTAGTPLYMAPELFAGRPATIATDIYSIGVLLFHLVTIRYPVEGRTLAEIELAHARHDQQRLANLRPDLPESFVAVVERALERDPARRYRDCETMCRDLMHAVQSRGSPDSAVAAGRQTTTTALAVLPFVNLGPDQDVEYFSPGWPTSC